VTSSTHGPTALSNAKCQLERNRKKRKFRKEKKHLHGEARNLGQQGGDIKKKKKDAYEEDILKRRVNEGVCKKSGYETKKRLKKPGHIYGMPQGYLGGNKGQKKREEGRDYGRPGEAGYPKQVGTNKTNILLSRARPGRAESFGGAQRRKGMDNLEDR